MKKFIVFISLVLLMISLSLKADTFFPIVVEGWVNDSNYPNDNSLGVSNVTVEMFNPAGQRVFITQTINVGFYSMVVTSDTMGIYSIKYTHPAYETVHKTFIRNSPNVNLAINALMIVKCGNPYPVRTNGFGIRYWNTLRDAYINANESLDVIQVKENFVTENLVADLNKTVYIMGGWDCTFFYRLSQSYIKNLTITNGSINPQWMVIGQQ